MAPTPIWRYPMSAAQLAARSGIPAGEAFDVLSTLGMDVPRETFDRLYGQAVRTASMVGDYADINPEALPESDLIQTRSTVTSTGFQYQFTVHAVEGDTGQEIELPFSIKTTYLITPGEAQESALIEQQLRAEDYNLQIQGATLTGIYSLEPLQEAA